MDIKEPEFTSKYFWYGVMIGGFLFLAYKFLGLFFIIFILGFLYGYHKVFKKKFGYTPYFRDDQEEKR